MTAAEPLSDPALGAANVDKDALSFHATALLLRALDAAALEVATEDELWRKGLAHLARAIGAPLVVVTLDDERGERRAFAHADDPAVAAACLASRLCTDKRARPSSALAALLTGQHGAAKLGTFGERGRGSILLVARRGETIKARERNLVAVFLLEMGRAVDRRSVLAAGVAKGLPARSQKTLVWLLRGLSEKEIADQLGLSHHTVHEYVKELYKRYGVGSRAELMARCLASAKRAEAASADVAWH